jgi:UDP-glucose 4-epimerase
MRVLVTGGTGFGGTGLVKALLPRHRVSVLDIVSPHHVDSLKEEIESGAINHIWKSVHDIQPEDIEGYEVICHFAAQADVPMGFPSPAWTAYENVMGTLHLLEAVRKVGCERFLLPSSGNVFGRPQYLPIDEQHPLTPHNPYAASKAAQEMFCWAYHRCYNLPLVVFRNGIVYGPGMRRDIFIYIWLYNLLRGKPIVVEGGDQSRDPCYVTDTIAAWLAAIETPLEKVVGQAFQISTGREYKVRHIAELCTRIVPGQITYTGYRPGEEGQRECFDISKAEEILGYRPTVDLELGLALTVEWIKSELRDRSEELSRY